MEKARPMRIPKTWKMVKKRNSYNLFKYFTNLYRVAREGNTDMKVTKNGNNDIVQILETDLNMLIKS